MQAWPPAVGIVRFECHLSSSICGCTRRLPGACPGLWPPTMLPAPPAARYPGSWSGRSTAWILRRLEISLEVLLHPLVVLEGQTTPLVRPGLFWADQHCNNQGLPAVHTSSEALLGCRASARGVSTNISNISPRILMAAAPTSSVSRSWVN